MPVEDQGAGFDRYRIIPRVLIFIYYREDVLLIKGAPTKRLWANQFNGIGGHIERGESVLDAARREVAEETGITTARLEMVGTVMVDAGGETGVGLFVFRGNAESRLVIPSSEGTLKWVNTNRTADLPLVEDLHTILPIVNQWKPGQGVFSARYYYDSEQQLKIIISDSAN